MSSKNTYDFRVRVCAVLLEIFDKIFYMFLNVCVRLHKIVLLQKRNIHYYCFCETRN
jgi:hypothetical protein